MVRLNRFTDSLAVVLNPLLSSGPLVVEGATHKGTRVSFIFHENQTLKVETLETS
jgi:hypothetical protein